MNSKKKEREKQHKKASKWASEQHCAVCGHEPPSEPCHFVHRGMGGGKAGWDLSEVWPGCRHCHDLADGRMGVSAAVEFQRDICLRRLTRYRNGLPIDPTEL